MLECIICIWVLSFKRLDDSSDAIVIFFQKSTIIFSLFDSLTCVCSCIIITIISIQDTITLNLFGFNFYPNQLVQTIKNRLTVGLNKREKIILFFLIVHIYCLWRRTRLFICGVKYLTWSKRIWLMNFIGHVLIDFWQPICTLASWHASIYVWSCRMTDPWHG